MPGFINPYHFVPIADKAPERKPLRKQRGELRGSIECTLTLHSPLAMPDHEHPQLFKDPKKKGEPLKDNKRNTIKHFYYPFYSLDGKYPLIPGSELRGMIRSVYEAETNSCLGIFDNAELTGRSQITKQNGGLIYKTGNQWFLEPADIYLVNTFSPVNSQKGGQPEHLGIDQRTHQLILENNKRISNGDCVTFNDSHIIYRTSDKRNRQGEVIRGGANTGLHFASDIGNGSLTGWLLIGEKGLANRHNSHILSPRTGGKIEMISQETVDKLQAVLNLYGKPEINKTLKEDDENGKKHTGYAGYSIKANGEKTPVFYTKVSDHFYLSPAMKGREVYFRQLYQVVGDHVPCGIRSVGQDAEQLNEKTKPGEDLVCPACALFGTIPDKNAIRNGKTILQNSYSSAIRFSDAVWSTEQEPQWLEREESKIITLPELSGPKITSSEFYSHLAPNCRSNEDGIWNMDYKTMNVTETIDNRKQKVVVRMFPLETNDIKINGRKFFWHQPEFAKAKAEDQAAHLMPQSDTKTKMIWTERNISTQVLKDGEFRFTVYFDGIQKDQLDGLIWALSPKSGDRKLYHKLGFGKPLGLGSVEIKIEHVKTRTFENGVYHVEEHPDWAKDKKPGETLPNELVEILDFERTGKHPVSYPIGKEEKNGKTSEGTLIWFKYNRSIGTTPERPAVNYTLPKIEKGNPQKGFDLLLPTIVATTVAGRFTALGGNAGPVNSSTGRNESVGTPQSPEVLETEVTIMQINEKHGKSAYCILQDGTKGFLKTKKDLRTKYHPGDKLTVKIDHYDPEYKSWQLFL